MFFLSRSPRKYIILLGEIFWQCLTGGLLHGLQRFGAPERFAAVGKGICTNRTFAIRDAIALSKSRFFGFAHRRHLGFAHEAVQYIYMYTYIYIYMYVYIYIYT
jgi:hypothetical protein